MVEHIVLFKWKAEATAEQITAAVEGLRGLKELVPNVLDLSVGTNFTDRGQGFTHGLVVRFPDKAALEVYGPHPAHQHVVQTLINPIRENALALDYEF
ncbi:MAG: Stress responsive alpha-beta barrel domain protein [Chthonomonadales bacterium]|nr:Stress responsive alpha-beta barrel domain protein [Chthonomonadales bacterium]